MQRDRTEYDLLSIGTVAIVGIIAVVLMVIELAPSDLQTSQPPSGKGLTGHAVSFGSARMRVGAQFDIALLDFNRDRRLDLYDFSDVLGGRIDCQSASCDLDGDGRIDNADQTLFIQLLRRLYDYNNDQVVDRRDSAFLHDVMMGDAQCDRDHVCDLDGDAAVSKEDLALFTSFIYNYEQPTLSSKTR